jgi:hypothetical protein
MSGSHTEAAKVTKGGGVSYEKWLEQLNFVARIRGYRTGLTHDSWRTYYEDDYTPHEALIEDESNA